MTPVLTGEAVRATEAGQGAPSWRVLVETIERLSAARTVRDVAGGVRGLARRISGADGVSIVLREGDLCHYVDEDAVGPLWKGRKFPMSSCISGWAMLNRRTVAVPDVYEDARIPHDVYRPTFVRSLTMVPMRAEDPLAAIGFYWADNHLSGPEEIALLETLARATATALANVMLDEQRLRAEEQFRQAQKMETVGQLTGGMAHDFNNLLAIVLGNLELMERHLRGNDRALELLLETQEAARHGADLTRRLLAFSRRQTLKPETVSPNEQVSSIVNLLRRTLGEAIEISLDLAPDAAPILVDPAQFEACIANLANNARDAMPKGGRLSISTRNRTLGPGEPAPAGDYVLIEVGDTGDGMAPEVMERIFEPFFTTKAPGKGTGLGLSMVFGFVKQSSGHVGVESRPGAGTTFRIHLPRA